MCREYKCFTFARYSPQCESSIIFATPHERPRMLTNTYEYLAIILRLVANCIRKPIRHIFATIWRICREYICLHSQGYSPQCETSISDTGVDKLWLSFGIGNILQNISIHDSLVMHLMDKLEIPVIESSVISMYSVSRTLTDVNQTHQHYIRSIPQTKPVFVEPDKRTTYQTGYV